MLPHRDNESRHREEILRRSDMVARCGEKSSPRQNFPPRCCRILPRHETYATTPSKRVRCRKMDLPRRKTILPRQKMIFPCREIIISHRKILENGQKRPKPHIIYDWSRQKVIRCPKTARRSLLLPRGEGWDEGEWERTSLHWRAKLVREESRLSPHPSPLPTGEGTASGECLYLFNPSPNPVAGYFQTQGTFSFSLREKAGMRGNATNKPVGEQRIFHAGLELKCAVCVQIAEHLLPENCFRSTANLHQAWRSAKGFWPRIEHG